jgi:hypothetical protein
LFDPVSLHRPTGKEILALPSKSISIAPLCRPTTKID